MALADRTLHLVERGQPAILAERDWDLFGLEEVVSRLSESGIVRSRTVDGFRVIEPSQYVGRLRLPGRSVLISPRWPDVFEAVRKYVSASASRVLKTAERQIPAEDLHALDPAIAFTSALEAAVLAGFPFSYDRVAVETTRPRGRLLVRDTIREFHAQGIFHKARYVTGFRHHDRSLSSIAVTASSLLRSRHDVATTALLKMDSIEQLLLENAQALRVEEALRLTDRLMAEYGDRPAVIRFLRIASMIFRNEQVVWDTEIPVSAGECRFCNTDRIWELAVLAAFRDVVGGNPAYAVEYHPFTINNVFLLSDSGGPAIDPDIVAFDRGNPLIVADGKYTQALRASADDVYQIVCYSARLKAKAGALIYISPHSTWLTEVGKTQEGVKVLACGIAMDDIAKGLVEAARWILTRTAS